MLPSTRSLEALEAVGRLGSLAAAGGELGLSVPALSRRLGQLEERLGVRLLERHARGLTLTPAGATYHAQVAGALRALKSAQASLTAARGNIVRVSTIPAFATRWLVPRLARFAAVAPQVEVDIRSSLAFEDLDAQDLDLAVRLMEDESATGVRLSPIRLLPVWSADQRLAIAEPGDVLPHVLLSPDHRPEFWREWLEHHGLPLAEARFREVDALLLYELALTGAGIAIGIEPLATPLLEGGRLRGARHLGVSSSRSFRLLTRDRQPPRPVRRFRDWLLAEARAAEAV